MITNEMKEFLKNLPKHPVRSVKFCVYMNRLQERLDRELDNLLWLCQNHPKMFTCESVFPYSKKMRRMVNNQTRLRKLLLCLKALQKNEKFDVQLVLKNDS